MAAGISGGQLHGDAQGGKEQILAGLGGGGGDVAVEEDLGQRVICKLQGIAPVDGVVRLCVGDEGLQEGLHMGRDGVSFEIFQGPGRQPAQAAILVMEQADQDRHGFGSLELAERVAGTLAQPGIGAFCGSDPLRH